MIAAPAEPHPGHPLADRPAEDTPPDGWRYTAAQWRIGRRFALGMSPAQVARALGIGEQTVESQIRRICMRLDGAGTRRERIVALVREFVGGDAPRSSTR